MFHCPHCRSSTLVTETRGSRRRRRCSKGHAMWTVEVVESALPIVPTAPPAAAGLSMREREVLVFAAQGLTQKETARQMGLSPRTVGHYQRNARAKLRVTSTRAAAALAATLD